MSGRVTPTDKNRKGYFYIYFHLWWGIFSLILLLLVFCLFNRIRLIFSVIRSVFVFTCSSLVSHHPHHIRRQHSNADNECLVMPPSSSVVCQRKEAAWPRQVASPGFSSPLIGQQSTPSDTGHFLLGNSLCFMLLRTKRLHEEYHGCHVVIPDPSPCHSRQAGLG